jgi:NAD(P)-dependent dehydrogenase (short-subunit alcohol dehydrogenase family)
MGVLEGKVAIITGGTSGIGARTGELFAAEGAHVVLAGRRREMGEALVARLGPTTSFVRTDVSLEADVRAMVDHTLRTFGQVDCLVNNAGTPSRFAGIADLDVADFDRILGVHLRGVALGMKHVARPMRHQGAGSIINMGSVAGLRAGWSAHTYSAAKAAVIHMTRCVAVELGEVGVRVNSISPGAIVSGIFGKGAGLPDSVAEGATDDLKIRFARLQPIPRAGLADDVARAALFLASDASSFVNGEDLVVDGGGSVMSRSWSTFAAAREELAKRLAAMER